MHELLYGIFFGLSIGIIIGPIAILCIKRSIVDGFLMGAATGMGAASTHLIYGSIAVFGLTTLKNFMFGYSLWLRILGGSYLLYLAFKAVRQTVLMGQANQTHLSYARAFISAFLLNMTNPIVIAAYAAFLSTFTITISTLSSGLALVIGIFLGDFSVFATLSSLSHAIRAYGSTTVLTWINRGAAVLLASFGVGAISTSLYKLFTT